MLFLSRYVFAEKNLERPLEAFYKQNRKVLAQLGKESGYVIGISGRGLRAKHYPTVDFYKKEAGYITYPDESLYHKGSVIIPNDLSDSRKVLDIIKDGLERVKDHYRKVEERYAAWHKAVYGE